MEAEQQTSSPAAEPAVAQQTPDNSGDTSAETTNQTQEQSTEQNQTVNGYEGQNYVDFTPEQLKRVNALTKKASTAEQRASQAMQVLKEQSDLINELRNGQSQIVSHLQNTNYADVEAQLKNQRKEAYARGDIEAVDVANDRLLEIKLARETAKLQAKAQPAKPVQQQSYADPVDTAVQQGTMSRDDAEAYRAWVNETDNYGNSVRPWTNETDARNAAAAAEGKAVFSNPAYRNKPFAERLKEIDRRMGLTNQQSQQGVLPAGNLTRGGKNSNIKLSTYAENLAVKTKFAGPGKTNADHIEAYRKQISEVRGAKK